MTKPRVVILGHAADRTGPPMYLLQLLEHLGTDDLDLTIVLLRGGELLPALEAHGEVRVVGEPVDRVRAHAKRLAEEPSRITARRAQLADLVDLDLVIVNTAWSIHALAWLPPGDHPVLGVVHELSAGVDGLLEPAALDRLLASDHLLTGCEPADQLLERLGVDPARRTLIPYGIDLADPPLAEKPGWSLDVSPGDVLVVAAGVGNRRKAPDLFVQLAAAVRRARPDVPWAFRWIGATEDDPDPVMEAARTDRSLLATDDLVRFIGPTRNLRHHLSGAHALALTSREDAFPLVVLEAAAASVPTACFDTGGIAAFARRGAGAVVPFPDVEAMADTLIAWHDDPATRTRLAAEAHRLVTTQHDIVHHARSFRSTVDRLLADHPRATP